MTRTEFEEKSFEDVMSQLNEELDEITTLDSLKEFIKEKIDEDNFCIASHLCNAIWNDPNPSMSGMIMIILWEHLIRQFV